MTSPTKIAERTAPGGRVTPDFRRVLGNAAWNLSGNLLPLAAAAIFIPLIIAKLGLARFGLLSLAWVLIGYFSLFDLGLGRAITKMIAERLGTPQQSEIQSIASTGLALLLILGLGGAMLVASGVDFIVDGLPIPPGSLRDEAASAIYVVAMTIPLVVVTSGLRGVLEGYQEFRLLNLIRIPAGVLLFAAPAMTAMFSPRLDASIAGLAAARLAILLAHVRPCRNRMELSARWVQRSWTKPMVRFGGWLTVSSIVGPIIVYMDRFILGFVQSAEAVAYYAAPSEVVSRLLMVPAALTVAMFPVMASLYRTGSGATRPMRRQALLILAGISVPVCVVGIAAAEPVLRSWLGHDFATNSTLALQLLLPGFALNAFAQIAVLSLQSSGRVKPVAVLHLVQLPLYASLLYWWASNHGIAGAAAAASVRAAFDCVALFALVRIVESREHAASPAI